MRIFLWPISILYGLVMRFRNHLYHIGYKKSFEFQSKVISVGNLSMGGNGKTPMVEYLISQFKNSYKIAVLSRGYGRTSGGFKLAEPKHTAADIGDEPLQMYRKFNREIVVAVGESRALAIPKILLEEPNVELIILDDAFQHREVVPQFSILVTNYQSPFFRDHLLPSGRLRESRSGVSRADVVVVTKCPPDISAGQRLYYTGEIHKYHHCPVYFTTIRYKQPVHFLNSRASMENPSVLLITGIAKPDILVEYISKRYTLAAHMRFRDHFQYAEKQVSEIVRRFSALPAEEKIILTTEKDMVKLMRFKSELEALPLFYLPIKYEFIEGEERFKELVLNSLERFKGDGR